LFFYPFCFLNIISLLLYANSSIQDAPFIKFCGEQRATCLKTCEDKIKEFVCNDVTGITTSPCLCEDGDTAAVVDPPSPPAPPATEDTPATDASGEAGKKPATIRPPAPDVPNPIDSPAADGSTPAEETPAGEALATDVAAAEEEAAAAIAAASSAARTTGSIALGFVAAAMLL
jgi:hypothetical protein